MQEAPNCAKNDWLCGYVRDMAKSVIQHPLHLIVASVKNINSCKAAGSDGIYGSA